MPLRILGEDTVYLLVGYADVFEEQDDFVEAVDYVPVGQELFGLLEENGRVSASGSRRAYRS